MEKVWQDLQQPKQWKLKYESNFYINIQLVIDIFKYFLGSIEESEESGCPKINVY